MTHHDLALLALGAWLALLAVASVQLTAEIRWRLRCRRRDAARTAPATTAPAATVKES